MPDLPVMLRVTGRQCVIAGGGAVALRRARSLLEAGAEVVVVAPRVTPELEAMPVRVERRAVRAEDFAGAVLAVIATDSPAANEAAARDARAAGALVNRADEPAAGDVSIPAHAHHGPVTLAVHTGGVSASAAAAIRRELSAALDPDWPRLLELVAPFRAAVRRGFHDADQRQERLARLTGPEAMRTLKERGPDALREFSEGVAEGIGPRAEGQSPSGGGG